MLPWGGGGAWGEGPIGRPTGKTQGPRVSGIAPGKGVQSGIPLPGVVGNPLGAGGHHSALEHATTEVACAVPGTHGNIKGNLRRVPEILAAAFKNGLRCPTGIPR